MYFILESMDYFNEELGWGGLLEILTHTFSF